MVIIFYQLLSIHICAYFSEYLFVYINTYSMGGGHQKVFGKEGLQDLLRILRTRVYLCAYKWFHPNMFSSKSRSSSNSHRGINAEYGINANLHLFRGYECWSTSIPWSTLIPRREFIIFFYDWLIWYVDATERYDVFVYVDRRVNVTHIIISV
jgi:hypothetical protein